MVRVRSDTTNSTSSTSPDQVEVGKTSQFALLRLVHLHLLHFHVLPLLDVGGGRARKTGIQLAGAAPTNRQRTLDQIGPTSVGPFVFQVPVRPRFASVDATSGDRGRRPGSTKRMILLDEYCENTALHDTRRYERTIAKSTTFCLWVARSCVRFSFVLVVDAPRSRENKAVNAAPFAKHLVTLARWNKIVHRILNFLTFNATYAGVIQHEKDFNDTILLGNLLGISTCLPTGDLRVTCTSSRR
ncbi:hypothetical protein HZH68_008442 [Vespula germanica]|uniref:Uncharacterized protein n=1 Tax=Vespula germanica TaxID=30212 RepID=A0A834N670_VESGE|nr:hypothetical protein HZH68_008442 [Vespula germanica]